MLISELLEPGCIVESYYLSMNGAGREIKLEHFLIVSTRTRTCSGVKLIDVVLYDLRRRKIKSTCYADTRPPTTWLKIIYTDGRTWSQAVSYSDHDDDC